MPPTYSEIKSTFVSSTLNAYQKQVIDQIWRARPMLAWAMAHKRPQVGGRKVFIPVQYGENTSIQKNLGRGSTFPLVQDEIITEAWYDWTTYGGSVLRYRDDDLENTGKYAVYNMLEQYIQNMVQTFQKTLEIDLFSTESTGANHFCGLRGLIEDVDTSSNDTSQTAGSNTVGNLPRGTYPWWTNWGRNMTSKDATVWLTHYLREAYDNVEDYTGQAPEILITHKTVRNLYEDEVGETLRTMSVKLGDIGYKSVEYKGVPFLTSTYATQTRLYAIGKDTVELIYEPRMWFKSTAWKEPTNQAFDYTRQTLAKGQFTIKKPRGTSVIYNINN